MGCMGKMDRSQHFSRHLAVHMPTRTSPCMQDVWINIVPIFSSSNSAWKYRSLFSSCVDSASRVSYPHLSAILWSWSRTTEAARSRQARWRLGKSSHTPSRSSSEMISSYRSASSDASSPCESTMIALDTMHFLSWRSWLEGSYSTIVRNTKPTDPTRSSQTSLRKSR